MTTPYFQIVTTTPLQVRPITTAAHNWLTTAIRVHAEVRLGTTRGWYTVTAYHSQADVLQMLQQFGE